MFEYHNDPVPYITIDNWFDSKEVECIWKELDFFTNSDALLPPEKTGTGLLEGGIPKKNNHAIFLDDVFQVNREISSILKLTRKFWDTEGLHESIMETDNVFRWLNTTNMDATLLSYYEDGGRYKLHNDLAVYTMLIHFWKEPKSFEGGDLFLGTENNIIEPKTNRLILFPSWAKHGVTDINMNSEKFSGLGRYTITNFLGLKLEAKK